MAEHSGKDILSSDVEIKGSIKFQKELLIDGKVEGEINSDGVLTIGENADIRGEIKTKSITVFGKVQGNITVGERCELKSRCTLQGDLEGRPSRHRRRRHFHRQIRSDQLRRNESRRHQLQTGSRPQRRARRAGQSRLRLPLLSFSPLRSRSRGKIVPAKLSVECPHCGFKQMEYAAAKTTMCRQCGGSFAPDAAPKPDFQPASAVAEESAPAAAVSAVAAALPDTAALMRKFDGLWGKQRNSVVECFDCKAQQEVTSSATSTTCPKCSAHLDLRDYKITTSFSRTIRTHGDVHVTARGDLSSSNVVCRSAIIEGRLRSNLHCSETATINHSGKIPGRLSADHVLIERKASVQFFRAVHVKSIEIRGHMTGEVVAETVVVIHRNASLDGNVTAKSISVEKGGMFTGQLIIGSSGLQQAELLPRSETVRPPAAAARARRELAPGARSAAARELGLRAECKKSCFRAVRTIGWAATCISRV